MGIIQTDVREFKAGQYVNTGDGFIGYVIEDNGVHEENDPYQVAICNSDEDRRYSASDLTLWVSDPSGRVVEADSENGVQGVIVDIDVEGRSVVKWKCFRKTQIWLNTDLEPVFV